MRSVQWKTGIAKEFVRERWHCICQFNNNGHYREKGIVHKYA